MYDTYAKYRDNKGLTDYKVAQKLNISQAALTQWKKRKTTPRVKTLMALADLLGVTVEELIKEE